MTDCVITLLEFVVLTTLIDISIVDMCACFEKFREFSNAEKKIKEIVDEACKQYGCKDFIESDVNGKLVLVGLTTEELNNTIGIHYMTVFVTMTTMMMTILY